VWNVANYDLARSVRTSLLSAYQHLALHSKGAKEVVAGLTDWSLAGSYKMSGYTYTGYPFSQLYSRFHLDRPPRTYQEAAIGSIVLNPRPDALNLALSPVHATQ